MFRIVIGISFLAVAGVGSTASVQILNPPQELVAGVKAAEDEGAAMYKLDQAVWVATDAAQAVKGFHSDKRVRGWLTQESEEGIRVTFYGAAKKQKPMALYRAIITPNGLLAESPVSLGAGEPLSEFERAQATAREKAMSIRIQRCSKSYNTVAMVRNAAEGESWSFYLLPGTTKKGVIMAGIGYRVDVDWEGRRVLSQRAFSKSCIEISGDQAPDGSQPVGAFLTHLLDPIPTPIHVFLSLQHHEMLAVGTMQNSLAWIVKDGRINRLDLESTDDEQEKKSK